jgi:hypothetical protein
VTTEARAHDELRDRLDHMRAVTDARGRVHAFIEAYDRMAGVGPVFRANGLPLHLDDLRVLLDAEFAPTCDTKQSEPHDDDDDYADRLHQSWVLAHDERVYWPRCHPVDDEDETGLHRRQAQAMRYAHSKGSRVTREELNR